MSWSSRLNALIVEGQAARMADSSEVLGQFLTLTAEERWNALLGRDPRLERLLPEDYQRLLLLTMEPRVEPNSAPPRVIPLLPGASLPEVEPARQQRRANQRLSLLLSLLLVAMAGLLTAIWLRPVPERVDLRRLEDRIDALSRTLPTATAAALPPLTRSPASPAAVTAVTVASDAQLRAVQAEQQQLLRQLQAESRGEQQQLLNALQQSAAMERATVRRAILTLQALERLTTRFDAGNPYRTELHALQALWPQPEQLQSLHQQAASGIASRTTLATELRSLLRDYRSQREALQQHWMMIWLPSWSIPDDQRQTLQRLRSEEDQIEAALQSLRDGDLATAIERLGKPLQLALQRMQQRMQQRLRLEMQLAELSALAWQRVTRAITDGATSG